MKTRWISVLLVLFLLISLGTPSFASEPEVVRAVYLGVVDYGTVNAADKDNFQYRFCVGEDEVIYKVSNANNYAINNILAEGYVFDLTVEDDTVVDISIPEPSAVGTVESLKGSAIKVDGQKISTTEDTKVYKITAQTGGAKVEAYADLVLGQSVKVYGNPANVIYQTFVAEPYEAPLRGTPGEKTIRNVLATAFEPVGTALYIYGGTWDWQDVGSSNQATTIGLSQTWVDFFQSKDDTFTYRNNSNYAESYYPHKSYNEYYYAGIDCSGYVGWVVYNMMNTESGNEGYVMSSTRMADNFANVRNYGTHTRTYDSTSFEDSTFKPGDVFSMSGHTWICVGVCEDGSILILHSTPSASKSGQLGGGVQLTGIGARTGEGAGEDCQAAQLAEKYMARYYPAWSERYTPVPRTYSAYTALSSSAVTGKFSWDLESVLSDPEGYTNMTAEEILEDLFGEAIIITGVVTSNGQADVNFDILSANGKGYSVYLSETGLEGSYKLYNNVNYNSKGVHIKGLTHDKTNYTYIEYNNGKGNISRSKQVELIPNE